MRPFRSTRSFIRYAASTALSVLMLASAGRAQNLQNPDFESWVTAPAGMTGQVPADWSLMWPNTTNMTSPSAPGGPVHCGTKSCCVDVVATASYPTGYSEVGKQWGFGTAPTQPLHARCRVLYPTAANQPSQTTTGTLKIRVAGFDSGVWTPVAGSSEVVVAPSDNWQEFALSYQPIASPTATLVRIYFIFSNGAGQRYYIDSVDFSGTHEPTYGTLQPTIARQVRSVGLSLIFDEQQKVLRELRQVSAGVAVGANYLAPGGSPLFEAWSANVLTNPYYRYYGAASPGSLTVQAINQPQRTGWSVAFASSQSNFGMTVDLYASPGDHAIFVETSVTRPSNEMLWQINCPRLNLLPYLGNSSQSATLVGPFGGGVLVHVDPATFNAVYNLAGTTPHEAWLGGEYPGWSALQMMSLDTDQQGIAVMALDEEGENKNFSTHLDGVNPRVDLIVQHRLPSVTGTNATVPVANFRRAIVSTGGSWTGAAKYYREWARTTQLWQNAAARTTAAWVDQRPTVFEAPLRPMGIGDELVPITDWDKLMDDWHALNPTAPSDGGGEMLPLFRDFEHNGTYAGPFYLPLNVLGVGPLGGPYPVMSTESDILTSWTEVHDAGHHPMAMVAGLKWAIDQPPATARVGTLPSALAPGCPSTWPNNTSYWLYSLSATTQPPAGVVAVDRTGTNYVPSVSAAWDFTHYVMDPRSSFAVSTHTNLATKMAGGGLDLYLFDQMNGGAAQDNFDTTLPPDEVGAGPWKVPAVRNLFAATLAAGRAQNDRFELAIEDPCEQAIDLISVQGVRPANLLTVAPWGRGESVPLFQFVYNEVASFVTWDVQLPTQWWASSSPYTADTQRLRMTQLARTLTSGSWQSVGIEQWMLVNEYVAGLSGTPCSTTAGQAMMPWINRTEAVLLKFLMSCVRTSQAPALAYLNSGEMTTTQGLVLPPQLNVELNPLQPGTSQLLQPQVFDGAWQLPGNHWALLLANAHPTLPATVTLPIAVGSVTLYSGALIKVYTNGVASTSISYSFGMTYPLAPGDVVLFTM